MVGLRAVSKDIAAGFLLRAWEAVSTQALDETWSIYEDFDQVNTKIRRVKDI
jgi:hypothetical protein